MSQSTQDLSNEHLRKILLKARNAAGMTQAELAERLRRPQSFVSKYERGERRLDIVEFIEVASALGIVNLGGPKARGSLRFPGKVSLMWPAPTCGSARPVSPSNSDPPRGTGR